MVTAQRAIVLLTGAAALAVTATPVLAQVDPAIVLNIMHECAKIDDPTARLACYDNNVRAGGATGAIPGQMARPNGGRAVANPNTPSGFGADDLRSQQEERFHPYGEGSSGGPREISSHVVAVRERQPGIYLVTIDGGAQWLFSEGVSQTYTPPRKGDTVRIEHGALGSYMMIVGKQAGVKVTRIK